MFKKAQTMLVTAYNATVGFVKKNAGKALAVVTGAYVATKATVVQAQTDLTSTITTVSGYWDAVLVIGIGIILFVVGRKVIRKL